MSGFELRSGQTLYVEGSPDEPTAVFNGGPSVLYYGGQRVTSSSNDGSVAVGATTTLTQSRWLTSADVSTVFLNHTGSVTTRPSPSVVEGRVTDLEADVATLQTSDTSIEADITALQSADVALQAVDAAVVSQAGVTSGGTVRRGKSIIATEESRSSTTYGTLSTPDRVQNVVLPTDGLIFVAFQAMWKESVNNAARASLFLNETQVKAASASSLQTPEAGCPGSPNVYVPLVSSPHAGLLGYGPTQHGTPYPGDTTTGQLVTGNDLMIDNQGLGIWWGGGVATMFAAAGVYDVSVRYKATSGSVTAKNRKLWVWTLGF